MIDFVLVFGLGMFTLAFIGFVADELERRANDRANRRAMRWFK